MKPVIYALVGPTCTGKSRFAIDLALKYPFEIISADSRLIYKEMDIGTSKPSLEDRKKVIHHMVDIVLPNEEYSVALYKNEAEKKIDHIFRKSKMPLFVGGTGLYLNSVLSGYSIPKVKPDYSFRKELKNIPQEKLYEALTKLDIDAAKKINKNDNFRTIRTLEVIYSTGDLFSNLKKKVNLPFKVIWVGLAYKNKNLHYEQIKKRTQTFCNNGFIDEVDYLLNQYGELDLFYNTIGYKEAINYLKGALTKDRMIEEIILTTRQYAKRQITWFRANKDINWVYLDDLNLKSALSQIRTIISTI